MLTHTPAPATAPATQLNAGLAPTPTAGLPTDPPWWTGAVVYQVYPRSFADSDGDGVGDLRGLLAKVDYLATLGVDVVWLSPVYPSPQADNGYDVADYQDIDPVFGTLADFDLLVDALHGRGMRLVMDVVVNHTSDQHPWFQAARASRHSPTRDWYVWKPARPGFRAGEPGAWPTNWESFFSGPTWTFDPGTGEYYLHLFSEHQPDLNWENPQLRAAIYAMMRWWLDRGVDGFRLDVINLISKDQRFPQAPTAPGAALGDGFAFYGNGPRLHEFLSEMRREVTAGRDQVLLTVGEMPGVTVAQARDITDPARAELDMVFQFEHVELDCGPGGKWDRRPLAPGALAACLRRWQEGLAERGWNALYLSNHDQPRSVSRFGDDQNYWYESATALATALHLLRGTPYIYQGEEIGMVNMSITGPQDLRDIESLGHWREEARAGAADPAQVLAAMAPVVRDNARTPMQWDAGPQAGFTSGTPWMPVNPTYRRINAASQVGAPGSIFEFYRALIDLRHREPAIRLGTCRFLDGGPNAVMVYERAYGATTLLVAANLGGEPTQVRLPRWAVAAPVELTNRAPVRWRAPALALAPWQAVVLRRTSPAAGEPAPQ